MGQCSKQHASTHDANRRSVMHVELAVRRHKMDLRRMQRDKVRALLGARRKVVFLEMWVVAAGLVVRVVGLQVEALVPVMMRRGATRAWRIGSSWSGTTACSAMLRRRVTIWFHVAMGRSQRRKKAHQ